MRVPTQSYTDEIEIKRSRFIGIGRYIDQKEERKPIIDTLRREHPQANHVVHAAIIGRTGEFLSASDDREPKNTAGRPVLEVLKGSGLTNIIVCVVRYFGGTLLGTGGLVKAYTEAAHLVVNNIASEELVDTATFSFSIPYEHYDRVSMYLKEYQREIECSFLSDVTLTLTCEKSVEDMVKEHLINLTNGTVSPYRDVQ
ncbi:MAG: IMPACT family protein [Sphaerochaetaceae bacterium]